MKLPVAFFDTRHVQPAEHVPCATWGGGIFLASDGVTVRPLPGRESDFENEAAALEPNDSAWKPVVFDPPLD